MEKQQAGLPLQAAGVKKQGQEQMLRAWPCRSPASPSRPIQPHQEPPGVGGHGLPCPSYGVGLPAVGGLLG